MHLVQSYPDNAGPGWITVGIADYVRYVYGCDNPKGGWALPDYSEKHNYDNSYRITARFFLWIENNVEAGFVKQLDRLMRTKTYTDKSWKELTGKTPTQLWEDYKKNPTI